MKGVTILKEADQIRAEVTRPDPELTFEIPDPEKLAHEFEETDRLEKTAIHDFIT